MAIQKALNEHFGGHTPIGATQSPPGVKPGGQWVDRESGETIYDMCWMVKVLVEPDRLEVFRKVVRTIGRALEQKAMYVEIGPPTSELIMVYEDDDQGEDIESALMNDLNALFRKEDDTGGATQNA